MFDILGSRRREDVQIARAEDESVQDLGNERNPLSTAIAVDGPYQDELGRRVGDIAEDVKEVELHGARAARGGEVALLEASRVSLDDLSLADRRK